MAYYEFISQLTEDQQGLIQRFAFVVLEKTTKAMELSQKEFDNSWLEICDELPAKLIFIRLDVNYGCWPLLPRMSGNWSSAL